MNYRRNLKTLKLRPALARSSKLRNLVVIFGDQLSHTAPALDAFDPACDRIWMAEVHEEVTHVWCHKLRIAFFFSAMRHFREELRARGWPVSYRELPAALDEDDARSF